MLDGAYDVGWGLFDRQYNGWDGGRDGAFLINMINAWQTSDVQGWKAYMVINIGMSPQLWASYAGSAWRWPVRRRVGDGLPGVVRQSAVTKWVFGNGRYSRKSSSEPQGQIGLPLGKRALTPLFQCVPVLAVALHVVTPALHAIPVVPRPRLRIGWSGCYRRYMRRDLSFVVHILIERVACQ